MSGGSDAAGPRASPYTDGRVYVKSDSFLEMRQAAPDTSAVHERLAALADRLRARGGGGYRDEILAEACGAMLAGEERFPLRDFVARETAALDDAELERYLFYRFRYEVFPREKRLDAFPPLVQIEPTSICNYRCVFCYQTDLSFTSPKNGYMGLMPLELFKRTVDELEGNVEAITLASRGEPLMHKQIVEMLDYLAGKFLAVKINTNASYLDEERCHAILRAGVNTLVFSADAAKEPLYSQFRVRGNLEKVMANVKLFHDIREQHYPDSRTITRVSGVKFSEEQDIDEMEDAWGGLVDQVAFVRYNPWENTYEQPINDVEEPCSEFWRRVFVLWDGTMAPCDVDYKATLGVGKVGQDGGVSDLWRSERYEGWRRFHLARQRRSVSPCNRCTVV